MQYPIIDLITSAYINNGWTGLDIPDTITYEPIHLGSGDPSPENIRPILPAKTLNIGGVNVPIYGGILDVTNKILSINAISMIDDGTRPHLMGTASGYYYATQQLTLTSVNGGIIASDKFKAVPYNIVYPGNCYITGNGTILVTVNKDQTISTPEQIDTWFSQNPTQFVYKLNNQINYNLSQDELNNAIGIKDDIAHRLKFPLPNYFPHPVIDALQRASVGTQTADDTEILRHYLTPLGIGGI